MSYKGTHKLGLFLTSLGKFWLVWVSLCQILILMVIFSHILVLLVAFVYVHVVSKSYKERSIMVSLRLSVKFSENSSIAHALILRPLSHQHLTEQHSSCFIIFCILSLNLLYLSIYISRVWVLWLDRYVGWVSLSSICCIYLSKYLQYKDGDWTYMLDGSAYYLSVVSIYLYI